MKKFLGLMIVFAGLGALLGASDVIFSEMRETIIGTIIYGSVLGGLFGVLILILAKMGVMSDLLRFKEKIKIQ